MIGPQSGQVLAESGNAAIGSSCHDSGRNQTMNIGVIGSGSIGPDLAYGFISALASGEGGKVYLLDIQQDALDAGMNRIRGYVKKGLDRGKLHPKVAGKVEAGMVPTMDMGDLADCDYVLEAASEDLAVKKVILKSLEEVVSPDCLIGFATSGLPRAQIATEAKHPERCFVNHPFFPAWRAKPIEVVPSGHGEFGQKMIDTLMTLGKVPIVTADAVCFAADDVFCNYCAEAARIVAEGTATPAQVDAIVNDAIGGGGPFNVMDLTKGNLLNIHCLELMRDAPTGGPWFEPPPIFATQANTPWHDRKNPGDPNHDEALKEEVLNRILAVIIGRTYFVVDNGICTATDMNWLTRNALGYGSGLLDLAEELGPDHVHDICTAYAERFPGFEVPESIRKKELAGFLRNVKVERDGEITVVKIWRPEVMNALNDETMVELNAVMQDLEADDTVKGIVLSSYDGALAGADIQELSVLKSAAEASAKCRRGHEIMCKIEGMKTPVVAAVDGPVLGGGAELSMCCHARVVGTKLMLGQPEVNLGIIPGYGGTQRLPRIIGIKKASALLRTGKPVFAKDACAYGWASGEPSADPVAGAKALIGKHLEGTETITPLNAGPVDMPPELPEVNLGHHSLIIDEILVDVLRKGLATNLSEALDIEADAFGRCRDTVDYDIGMTNFIQNGPRVPADFLHE
jgi:enoyl-CoA hydratase / 3-hydroxyacyl-CoA dehydrogenase